MNKEFVKKMIKAKALEYEAFKELFTEYAPQPVVDKVTKNADEIKGILKEAVFEIMSEDKQEEYSKGKETAGNKKNRKVNVDFGFC